MKTIDRHGVILAFRYNAHMTGEDRHPELKLSVRVFTFLGELLYLWDATQQAPVNV